MQSSIVASPVELNCRLDRDGELECESGKQFTFWIQCCVAPPPRCVRVWPRRPPAACTPHAPPPCRASPLGPPRSTGGCSALVRWQPRWVSSRGNRSIPRTPRHRSAPLNPALPALPACVQALVLGYLCTDGGLSGIGTGHRRAGTWHRTTHPHPDPERSQYFSGFCSSLKPMQCSL
jgi:hypothetical protein